MKENNPNYSTDTDGTATAHGLQEIIKRVRARDVLLIATSMGLDDAELELQEAAERAARIK